MPRDMFGEIGDRPARRAPRSSIAVLSAAAHAVTLVALVLTALVAPGVLPSPAHALQYFTSSDIVPVVPVTLLPRPSAGARSSDAPSSSPAAAPVEAPSDITPETGVEPEIGLSNVPGIPAVGGVDGLGGTDVTRSEPPPPPPPPVPVRLHAGIRAPQRISGSQPAYPPVARASHIQGLVVIEATIDATGHVTSTKVLRSVALLDQAALDAVREWRFTPALLNGVPIPVIITVTVNFVLDR